MRVVIDDEIAGIIEYAALMGALVAVSALAGYVFCLRDQGQLFGRKVVTNDVTN